MLWYCTCRYLEQKVLTNAVVLYIGAGGVN